MPRLRVSTPSVPRPSAAACRAWGPPSSPSGKLFRGAAVLIACLFLLTAAAPALAVDVASDVDPTSGHLDPPMFYGVWAIAFVGALAGLLMAFKFYKEVMAADEGTPRMIEIAGFVREGANAYLTQQYKVVALFFVVIAALLAYAAFVLKVQNQWVPFAFITGGFFSGLAGWFGMKTATWASSRTAAGAQKSLNQGLQVAFRAGAVMGLTVVGLALLDICIWFAILRWGFQLGLIELTVTMLCFGLGASAQALFARVGGGIFTKAADVGADLVGKVEQGIPEDDPRNPATIADNVGDNVGDVAGMGADLYESYIGSILATAALGVAAFAGGALTPVGMSTEEAQLRALFMPMTIAGMGILLSIVGIFLVRAKEGATQKNLLAALAKGIDTSCGLVALAAVGLAWWLMPAAPGTTIFGVPGVAGSIIVGLLAGWAIGKWTEYSTSDEFKPTRRLSDQAVTGPATIIIGGIADGMLSVWLPVLVVAVATVCSFGFATGWQFVDMAYFSLGLYGVGIAAVGMLSTLGITLATDAYGPIADNAGGNAEMSGLDPIVRERTDALDSLGNTTAATGKGFAIGSAALTALALLAAYVEEVRLGFQHWEEAVVAAGAEEGFYKESPQFVVEVTTGTDAQGEPLMLHDGWLILDGARDRRWRDLPLGAPVEVELDAAAGTLTYRPTAGEDRQPIVMEAVNRRDATLVQFTDYYDASLMNPKVLIGVFIGAMSTFVFCAMTMKAVGRAAQGMVEEVRRQFKEKKGIMLGTEVPDYATPVAISTKAAQREMILPSLLGLLTPLVVGLLLGVAGVMGLLVGTLTCGFCLAIFMANSGGSWDNAKKYIEAGHHGGKGTEAHKAAVVGDTVGDPFKDTSGPSLNILIKLMSMVSVVAAGVVVRYSLVAMGIF